MLRTIITCSILVWLFCGLGCRSRQAGNVRQSDSASSQSNASQIRAVIPIDQGGLAKLIKERNGRTLVLNLWATWCAPCVEEFPDLVKLAKSYSEQEVEVVGISADYPDEVESKIMPFLRRQGVPFMVYVADFQSQQDFINGVNSSWSGALPATLVFDKQGKQRSFLVGEGTYDKFRKMVDSAKVAP